MKKFIVVIMALVIICSLFTGCATLTYPVGVITLNNPAGSKEGRSSGKVWLGLFGNVDTSVQTAAKNGNITQISTIQCIEKVGLLGLWKEYTVIVTGE